MFLTRRYSKKTGWGINVLYGIKLKVKGMLQNTVSESMILFFLFQNELRRYCALKNTTPRLEQLKKVLSSFREL